MIERTVLALWLAVALLLAVASGAITYAVLTDEETVSVEISASATVPIAATVSVSDRRATRVTVEPGDSEPQARSILPERGGGRP